MLSSVLALTFVALLVTPIAAMAASGLPATVTMIPEAAGPGATVEVTGLDFPANQAVQLQLTTTAGAVHLGTATTADGGYFREVVTLPGDAPPGLWELRASGPDGSVAAHVFEAGEAVVAVETAELSTDPALAALSSGNSTSDIVVMLVFALLIAGVGGGIAYVYYQSKLGDNQPGMSAGADPIWSGGGNEQELESMATDEPNLKTAQSEV
jgi:hypothetical protein